MKTPTKVSDGVLVKILIGFSNAAAAAVIVVTK
jgi:hypothetical protein